MAPLAFLRAAVLHLPYLPCAKDAYAPSLFLSSRIRVLVGCFVAATHRQHPFAKISCVLPYARETSFPPSLGGNSRITFASVRAAESPVSRGTRVLPVSPLFAEDRVARCVRSNVNRPAGTAIVADSSHWPRTGGYSLAARRLFVRFSFAPTRRAERRQQRRSARVIRAVGGLSVVAPGAIIVLAFEFDCRYPLVVLVCPAASTRVRACVLVAALQYRTARRESSRSRVRV